jgi:co-chaperonin GroES (HSP10)
MLEAIKRTVILEAIQKEAATESGLILQGQDNSPTEARVVSVGPKVDCGLVVGDRVIVDWNRVGKMNHNDKTYYVTDQSNIVGVFTD